MDFFTAVENRRSVRKYTSNGVPQEVMQRAFDAALLAPNSSNMQPWEIFWVRSPEKKQALVKACLDQGAARTGAELVVFTARMDNWRQRAKWNEEQLKNEGANKKVLFYYKILIPFIYTQGFLSLFGYLKRLLFFVVGLFRPVVRTPTSYSELQEIFVKTTALACENFMLAVSAQGYGTCPMEGFDAARLRKALRLSRKSVVVMVISVGEVDSSGIWGSRKRLPKNEVVFEV